MKANQRGLQFEREFGAGLRLNYYFVVKFPDTRSLRMKQKIVESTIGKKFHEVTGLRSPADWWTMEDGQSILWECKQTQGVNKNYDFPIKNVKEHQVKTLQKHTENGGLSYLVINIKNETFCEYYVLDIHDYIHLLSQYKASIPRVELNGFNQKTCIRYTPKKNPFGDKVMIVCT